MTGRHPRIWVLLGHRTGDNNQMLALAEALRMPFETRTLHYNLMRVLHPWLGASLASLDRACRKSLGSPFPDLVIGIGWRSVAPARWIKNASGGRTKIVRLGNPRSKPDLFDLIITTPQYPVADAANILRLPLGISRFQCPPRPTAAEKAFLDDLPRPHRMLAVGGPAKYWRLSPDLVRAAVLRLARRGGTQIAITSPRTPPEITATLATLDGENIRVVTGGEPRFPVLLADADEIHVTGDSVAMLSEAVLSGKPVGIIPIEPSDHGRKVLGRNPGGNRDLRRFWSSLRDRGLAGTLDNPIAGQVENPAATAADAVKALLGDCVE
ncbi:MAG TPA: ELM1/GtrOC1 family putative glycosyltransferase [Sphingomicrobium sp.]|nr:ELM1/GtrOC1 family putative glycosyltransferase [Sphingomicrobium sp.]